MLMTPPRCWRNLDDCKPMHSIEALPPNMTDADYDALEGGSLQPYSFVCAGCVRESARAVPQDAYRLCWVNDQVDEMGEYDEQDVAHQIAVLSQLQAIISARRTAQGFITVPADDGTMITVETMTGEAA
jgi:hypothetical protein